MRTLLRPWEIRQMPSSLILGEYGAAEVSVSGIRNVMEGSRNVINDQDLCAAGMDTLQVMQLVRQLRSSLRDHDGEAIMHLIS